MTKVMTGTNEDADSSAAAIAPLGHLAASTTART
jgi:hypothetical protein